MRRLFALAAVLSVTACEPSPSSTRHPVLRFSLLNDYAVSLFSLATTPTAPAGSGAVDAPGFRPLGQVIQVWADERVESGSYASGDDLLVPKGCAIDWALTATSLGEKHRFTNNAPLIMSGDATVFMTYDFDLATADFKLRFNVN